MDEHTIGLICRVVDGCATAEEEETLRVRAGTDPAIAAELAEQRVAAGAFRCAGLPEPSDELRERFWGGVYNRLERRTGWVLVVLGTVLVLGYALYEILHDPSVHVLFRVGLATMVLGFGLVFSGVWRARRRLERTDRYRGVMR